MITSTYFILVITITACAGNGIYSNYIGKETDQDVLLDSIVNLIQQNGGKMTEPYEAPHVLVRLIQQ